MIKKNLIKFVTGVFILAALIGNETNLAFADNEDSSSISRSGEDLHQSETTIQQNRAAKVVWVYKEENGKKYMRLYDATNEVWLSDWILCE